MAESTNLDGLATGDSSVDNSGVGMPGPQTSGPVPGGDSGPSTMQQTSAPLPITTLDPDQVASNNQPQIVTPPDVPGNHAKLLGMLQGLAVATSAFGKAIATHGREGGAQDVLQYQAQQQAEARANQDQQMKQKEFDLRSKALQANTNAQILNTQIQLAKAPDEIQAAHIGVQNAMVEMYEKAGVPPVVAVQMVQGQGTADHVRSIKSAMQGDTVGNTAIPNHSGDYGDAEGKTNVYSFDSMSKVNIPKEMAAPTLAKLNGEIDIAEASGVDKSVIAGARARVAALQGADTINGKDLFMISTGVENPIIAATAAKKAEIDTQTKQAELKQKQEAADPLYKLENDPNEMAGEKSTAAISLLQNKLASETDPAQKLREQRLLTQATAAHTGWMKDTQAKANADQVAKQGDPKSAGKLLASGDLTLADLKTRGVTPKFIEDSVMAAKGIDPKYNASDEIVGEQLMKNAGFNAFTTSANSLLDKGGTLDQLGQQFAKLPNGQLPVINKVSDWLSAARGKGPTAGFAQTVLGVADDYAKVMGGGKGSDSAREEILTSFARSHSPEAMQAALDAARNAVKSQLGASPAGRNRYVRQRVGYNLDDQGSGAASNFFAQHGGVAH